MSPLQFDSDMSDANTTPLVRYPANLSNLGDLAPLPLVRYPTDLTNLGDLAPLPLVRQHAEPRDPWEIAIEVGYIPFTPAPLTIALSSDLMDVDL